MRTILCYGDSNTWGFNPETRTRYAPDVRWTGILATCLGAGYRVIEEGLNGRTTRWDDPIEQDRNGLTYLRPCIESHDPLDLVIVMLGTNDLKRRFDLSASDIAESAADLAASAHRFARGADGVHAKVLLVAPPAVTTLTEYDQMFAGAQEKSRQFSHYYRLAAAWHHVPFFDAGAVVVSSEKDGIHLDPAAHRALGEALARAVRHVLDEATRRREDEGFMRAITITPGETVPDVDSGRVVITEDVKVDGQRLRKGHRLGRDDVALLAALDRPVHAVVLEPDDVHENDAGSRLAAAVAGPGLDIRGPAFSRYNLVANTKGLLRVDADALLRLNRLPGVAVFTLADRLPVVPGKIVTGVKVTPVAVAEETVRAAEAIAAAAPVVRVVPFQPLRVGVISTEGPGWRVREKFEASVAQKIGWYGGSVMGFSDLPRDAEAIAAAIERLAGEGVDLVLAAGGNTIDPLDPTLGSLALAGAEIVRFGAPAHPGSMFWLAYRGDLPIFNLASCSMFSKATIADVVLPWIMTGERVEADTLAGLGFGGLLDRGMGFRFPPYDVDRVEEKGEE